jgi:hypothetical protein
MLHSAQSPGFFDERLTLHQSIRADMPAADSHGSVSAGTVKKEILATASGEPVSPEVARRYLAAIRKTGHACAATEISLQQGLIAPTGPSLPAAVTAPRDAATIGVSAISYCLLRA